MKLTQERVGDSRKVEVREFYKDDTPPRRVFKTIRKVLDQVPQHYLKGLDCVVLTNMSGQPRHRRLGKIPSSKGRVSRSKVPLMREFVFGEVLLHEIGHHIHETVARREHSDKEDVAERWNKELWGVLRLKRNRFTRIGALFVLHPIKIFLRLPRDLKTPRYRSQR